MKCNQLLSVVALLGLLCACGQTKNEEQTIRPVKVKEVIELGNIEKSYSGIVSPDQFSNLAFKMSGPLVAMNVEVGQRVKKGQVVAELDPTDFRIDLEAKKASYQNAKSQVERSEKLLAKNAISTQEYETNLAAFTNAKSAYENAQNTLEETKLRAPFDGFIQNKAVENYQRVQPGEKIVCLINPDKLEIAFNVPENNLPYILSGSDIYVEFDAYKGKRFKAKLKKYVEASPDGAGIPAYLYMDDPQFDPKTLNIAVGFSCRVTVNPSSESIFHNNEVSVPLSSIVFDNRLNSKTVFVFNTNSNTVEQRKVNDSGVILNNEDVVVAGQIKAGEKVVVAGASYLVDGQQVKLLTE
ncbi:MAG: efflux RND transporter periplasmic adaptor subunit [Phocaeicola sp.]